MWWASGVAAVNDPASIFTTSRAVRFWQAGVRRRALIEAGCATYITWNGGILCLCCGSSSVHPMDISEKYCGFCHDFHGEWSAAIAETQRHLLGE